MAQRSKGLAQMSKSQEVGKSDYPQAGRPITSSIGGIPEEISSA
jgi:hypothetical protein